MPITTETPVGEIAARHPLATRVFARHKIDFCCGGGLPLAQVCGRNDLDASAVLAEIDQEIDASPLEERWDEANLTDLIDHIVQAYHRPLQEELPRLDAMARKVLAVHGTKDPERLPILVSELAALKSELEQHMRKEELILFPMIREGRGAMAGVPMAVMEHEHASAGAALARLRELTDEYTPPDGACNTWRALWFGLADLERALHEHIHLENNVLFPRAAE